MTDLARPVSTRRWTPDYAKDKDRPYVGDPWDKQPFESSRAHEAFTIFISLEPGERTIAEAGRIYCERYNLSTKNRYTWSTKHRWVERAEAYDNFMAAKEIAAHKRQRVRAATKHAKQAADAQEVVMLPVNELRKRIEAQGGELAIVSELDDVSLMKLWRAFGAGELTALQKAERDALTSTGDVPAPKTEIRAKGELVRAMLANPTVGLLLERLSFESSASVEDEPKSDP